MPHDIHQLVHTLSYGDAISTEVLALQRVFRSQGRRSEIFALNVHPKLKGQARDHRELSDLFEGEVVLHYSLGSPLNSQYLALRNARRTLIFHNLTPSSWFRGINPRIVEDIEQGIKELPELCRATNHLLADSPFNAGELARLGFQAEVLELTIDPARWELPSNPGIADLVRSEGGIHVLHVGRLAPNKCIEDVIKSFYFLWRYVEPNSRLWLVGIDIDTELYSFALKRMVRDFGMSDRVTFAGCLADEEVKSLYEQCSVYMCMSEHEGFCLPVVEAMYFGLPVIAYGASAIPDTLGKGGILVRDKRHPELGHLIAHLARSPELRERLRAAGHERVRELSFERFEERVRTIFP